MRNGSFNSLFRKLNAARSMLPKLLRYVTPEQKHSGKAAEILTARAERKRLARLHRLKTNREQVRKPKVAKAA